ncbi:MAG: hypothetical protein ACTSQY_07540 [Candidatus Odinarchaeia archaeon]
MSEKWFEDVFPDAKKEFPEEFNPKPCQTYKIEFIEDEPRPVPVAPGRLAGVIEILLDGEKRSLFISRKYFGQKLLELCREHGSLMGLKVTLHLLPKKKRYYEYEIEVLEE